MYKDQIEVTAQVVQKLGSHERKKKEEYFHVAGMAYLNFQISLQIDTKTST
jgi:hypothetical protein